MVWLDKPLLVVYSLLLIFIVGIYFFSRSKYTFRAYRVSNANTLQHKPLHPTKIALDKLIRKVAFALYQETTSPPKLFVEQVQDPSRRPFPYIIADVNQITYLLVKAILRVNGKLNCSNPLVIRMQLQNTFLQFKQPDPIGTNDSSLMLFQATALLISSTALDAESLPKIKHIYNDFMDTTAPQEIDLASSLIDLQQETISSIVRDHYGYVEYPIDAKQEAILLVLPIDVTDIMNNMNFKLPIDCLNLETPARPKEQTEVTMALMHFHAHLSQFSDDIDPIDLGIISHLLMLLQQHFHFKRHASGQLFYVRAVGIANIVLEWFFYAPKVIYASLLYGLVCHNYLPLTYVREHYSSDIYAIVLSLLGVDKHKRQGLKQLALVYMENRLEKAMNQDQVQIAVLCIKLAERLYDLDHAASYIQLVELQHMAQETLSIDINLANEYLGPQIGMALKRAAKQALKICKNKGKSKDKDQDQDS